MGQIEPPLTDSAAPSANGAKTCDQGYCCSNNGEVCLDVDECLDETDNCPAEATCVNTPGSFECKCPAGYRFESSACAEIDECAEASHDCPAQTTCVNTPGSFTCTCPDGWQLQGSECVDVDECALGLDDCGAAGCINKDGGFNCGVDLSSYFAITFWWDPPTRVFDDDDFDLVEAANFNLLPSIYTNLISSSDQLDYAAARGMQTLVRWEGDWNFVRISAAAVDQAAATMAERYAARDGMFGYWLTDEPHADEFPMLARAHQQLLANDPYHVPYENLYPIYASSEQLGRSDYDTYVRDYMATVRPKVLCYDNYALTHSSYYRNMEIIRKYAVQYNVPFWYVLLSSQHLGYPNPNEALLRWQVFSALAYGAKGISYYTYWCRELDDYLNALVNKNGSLDAKYHQAKAINAELQVLGPILGRLKSRAVYHSEAPAYTSGISGSGWVTSLSGGPAIIGELQGDSGRYLMITNRDSSSARTFRVSVAGGTTGVARVDKASATGETVPMSLSGGSFQITLAAGNGELFKLTP